MKFKQSAPIANGTLVKREGTKGKILSFDKDTELYTVEFGNDGHTEELTRAAVKPLVVRQERKKRRDSITIGTKVVVNGQKGKVTAYVKPFYSVKFADKSEKKLTGSDLRKAVEIQKEDKGSSI